ncbi:type III-B CRISPR-associated protein Cas10/Cmr2 [Geobacillus thermoleovorans]|uniref:type III-B CRISPR-associated protein Cas10/Cmr2 n=1 Tax=Geobacillus thermoleovorans TaxID=33941 RepID=UPI00345B5876
MTNRYVVIFTVGPVQSFIASARKTEDFWSGSYILSHLVREAIKRFYQFGANCEMVYPLITEEELRSPSSANLHIASIPNRLTVIMEGREEEICGWLREAEQDVRNVFLDFCFQAVQRVFPQLLDYERKWLKKIIEQQVQSFLEIYWVAEPYEPLISFRTVRERAERRLGALKNEKHYVPVSQQGFVCTVCKEREALRLEEIDSFDHYSEIKKKTMSLWQQRAARFQGKEVDEEDRRAGRIKDNEFLCGICLGKRVARDYFADLFGASFPPFPSVLDIGKGSYYAVLLMDGDNMGKWFSGEGKEEYSEMSWKLARFAKETVPNIVMQQCGGQLVYAGGDDVLAFLPVENVLNAAEMLRRAFSDEAKGLGDGATASFGLVIAHKKAPLQHVLNAARASLEQKAKSYRNDETGQRKDALALAVYTRSGEISEAVLPWNIGEKMVSELLKEWVALLKTSLSPNFVFRFASAFAPLLHEKNCPKWENRDMLSGELRRLLKRSVKEDSRLSAHDIDRYAKVLSALHEAVRSGYDFLHLLKMLTFFKRSEGKD